MISVGLDVHVRNSFCVARDAAGKRLAHGRCGNSVLELAQALCPVERAAKANGESVRVVLESTANSRPIAQWLTRYGAEAGIDLKADVLHARKVRIIADSTIKCDRVDAAALCELAGSNLKLPVCYVPDDEVFALREHLRSRSDLVRVRTMLKNRMHALLHRRGVLSPAKLDLFSKAGRCWLDELTLDAAGRSILDHCLEVFDKLENVIKASTGDLRELVRRDRWCKPAALLQTMPGVGLLTSLTILAELGDLSRFRSRAAVSNFAGLTPSVRDSNEKTARGGITRRGPSHLRAALVEAAWIAVGRSVRYGQLYQRIAARRGKQVAIVAVARRMLEDAFTMMRKGQVFRDVPSAGAAGTPRRDQVQPVAPGAAG